MREDLSSLKKLLPAELAELVFKWPVRQGPRLALPLCIVMAVLIQTGVILLFSIRYPAPSAPYSEPPPIFFLPKDSDLAHGIAAWLEAYDPAIYSPLRAAREVLPDLPPLAYRPSYLEPSPPLHPLPQDPPPGIDPPDLPASGIGRPAPCSRPDAEISSPGVAWMDGLGERIADAGEMPSLAPGIPRPIRSLLLEAGFDTEGNPIHCVVLESTGEESADDAGKAWVLTRKLSPSKKVTWGRIRITWSGASLPPHNSRP